MVAAGRAADGRRSKSVPVSWAAGVGEEELIGQTAHDLSSAANELSVIGTGKRTWTPMTHYRRSGDWKVFPLTSCSRFSPS